MASKIDLTSPWVMGVLNVTPDSFSDGGQFVDCGKALEHAQEMLKQGAKIIDVGGESTRPGAERVSAEEQKNRVCNVIQRIASAEPEAFISIDTTLSEVAEAALDVGAAMLNDVSAGRDDIGMVELAASRNVPICLMHMQGQPSNMQDAPHYQDVVKEVCEFLQERADVAIQHGVDKSNIILDPGIGFGKTTDHNLTLVAQLNEVVALGFPVLLGTSRKRFMGSFCKADDPQQRIPASCATTLMGLYAGASIFRVHDVWQHRQVVDLFKALPK